MPREFELLIYDEVGSESFKEYLDPKYFYVLDTRVEKLNLFIFLKSIIKKNFKWNFQSYIHEYIKEINPKIIISAIDNNLNYWMLKNYFKDIKIIFIQNGIRDRIFDIFDKLDERHYKKFTIDKMFVFNRPIGKVYSKYINGDIIPIGSINNNKIPISNTDDGSIIYISQWTKYIPETYPLGYKHFVDFHYSEEYLFKLVSKFSSENNLKLKVLGRSFNEEEEKFFKKINNNFIFLKRDEKSKNTSYKRINESKFVVTTDSTLGYEALSRGKKTAIISCRGKFLNMDILKFGWPYNFDDYGPFWTNINDESYFFKIMNYLQNVSDKEWSETVSNVIENIMLYDYNNKILKNNFKKLNLKTKF